MAKREHARLADYSDREFLNVMVDLGGTNGGVTAEELAERLGIDAKSPSRNVGSRLAWLRRYGAVEKVERSDGVKSAWRLTASGGRFALGTLTTTERKALDALPNDHLVDMVRITTARYRRLPVTAAHLVRRQWTHGTRRES